MRHMRQLVGSLVVSLAVGSSAEAQVSWTDWTASTASSATGSMSIGSSTVGVTYSGPSSFVQTGCGTNYWTFPATYISATVPTAPPPCDIVALNAGGLKTVSFSQAVVNPLIAIASWNGQSNVVFSGPIQILSQGRGYWGTGTLTNPSSNVLSVSGEGHGVIQLLGTYSSFTFTDVSEDWHGFTIGVQGVSDPSVVPEPTTYALMSGGLLMLAGLRARRRRV